MPATLRPLQTRFRFAFDCACLKLATDINSLAHSPKGTLSETYPQIRPLQPFVSIRFQILFHSPRRGSFHLSLTVLVHYRSSRVFSLGGWTPRFPTGLASPVVLRILRCVTLYAYRALTVSGRPSQIFWLPLSTHYRSPTTPDHM